MHWRIKLKDDNGQFWLSDRPRRMWTDIADDAYRFTSLETAYDAADHARDRIAHNPDWCARVTIVKFLDS
jgi:hypothetical protein